MSERLYRYYWLKDYGPHRSYLPGRKDQLCRVLVRGKTMNSVLVEFVSDGCRIVISNWALRKA